MVHRQSLRGNGMEKAFIRKYTQSDRENVRKVCIDTADASFKKSKKMLDCVPIIYNDYFTEQEPENIFVIDDGNGKAVGYILCSTDFEKFVKMNKEIYLKRLLKTHLPSAAILLMYIHQLKKIKRNSVHLHIDILPEFQHSGFGTELIDTLYKHLKENGHTTLSVCGISRNSGAYGFYTKCGFHEIYSYGAGTVSLAKNL